MLVNIPLSPNEVQRLLEEEKKKKRLARLTRVFWIRIVAFTPSLLVFKNRSGNSPSCSQNSELVSSKRLHWKP